MKKHLLLLCLLLTVCHLAEAQKITLKGTLADSSGKILPNATVLLLSGKDSTLVSFTRTKSEGTFAIPGLNPGAYLFKVTYVGMQSIDRKLELNTPTDGDLGTLTMLPLTKQLNEVNIKGERAPIAIKGDTIEYNAGSFKTQPNAVVEDLLKKLPGVQVERDGTIKAQGEQVRRVLVDGKEFFGRDPKMATKNLPADAVDKVQVFDKKSDVAEFTGIDDGQRDKTINLSLKEDRKKGIFGTIAGGAGPDERYKGRVNLNRFDKTRQMSAIGMANNVNEQGFSFEDYLNFSGGLSNLMRNGGGTLRLDAGEAAGLPLNQGGRNSGFLRNWAGGLNFNNQFNKKTELNGSYFYNNNNSLNERSVNRENFLPNRNFTTKQDGTDENTNQNHRLNFTLDHKIDSTQSVRLNGSLTHNRSDAFSSGFSQSLGNGTLLENESERRNVGEGDGLGLNTALLYRKRLAKKGRNFSLNGSLALNSSDQAARLNAVNSFYAATGARFRSDTIRQLQSQANQRSTVGVGGSFTEPIGRRKYLEANYNYSLTHNEADQRVFDLGKGDNPSQLLNTTLSNQFESDFAYHRVGLGLRFIPKNANLSFGLSYQHADLNGQLLSQNTRISQRFRNVLPRLNYNYNFSMSNRLDFRYETNVREPSIQQLSPLVDNTDPLNIRMGNPALRPEYSHRTSLNYQSFNQLNFSNFFVGLQLTYTSNKITNAQTIDQLLVRTSKPINVAYDYMTSVNINYGFRIKPLKTRVSFSPNISYNRGFAFVNGVENRTDRWMPRADLRFDYILGDVIDFGFGGNISYTDTKYSISKNFNQSFVNQDYFADLNITLPKNWRIGAELNYFVYSGLSIGQDQRIPILEASIAKSFLKNKRGELKLSGTDLLNRNLGVNRRAELNFVEEERIRSLGRYFLLTFTYSLKSMGNSGMPSINIVK